jgi:DNA-binding CsgD family transcriptional regulator
MRLRDSEWHKLFTAIAHLYSDIDPDTSGERALAAINILVAGDVPAFNFFDGDGRDTGKNWHEPGNSITDDEFELFTNVAHEHPFIPDMFGKGRRDAMKTTDFLSPAQFRRTSIYNEFYRLFPIQFQLSIALSPEDDSVITCTTNRSASDFTEGERLMFNLLAPHLTNNIRNARRFKDLLLADAHLNSAIEAKSSAVVTVGPDREVVYTSRSAWPLIEKYFGKKASGTDRLPERLLAWICARDSSRDVEQLETEGMSYACNRADSELKITLIPNGNANETILILEEIRKLSPLNLIDLGMTKRQTEVLFWMSQGKTDNDIAFLLGISPRTVHKHTESIYVKLGVETRTAAALVAIEKLRSH